MFKIYRVIIVGLASLFMLSVAVIILGRVVMELLVDDGCKVYSVDVLPDIGEQHHYNITLSCRAGNRTETVITKDPPPTPGDSYNPSKGGIIFLAIVGIIFLSISLFLLFFVAIEFASECRKSPTFKAYILS